MLVPMGRGAQGHFVMMELRDIDKFSNITANPKACASLKHVQGIQLAVPAHPQGLLLGAVEGSN